MTTKGRYHDHTNWAEWRPPQASLTSEGPTKHTRQWDWYLTLAWLGLVVLTGVWLVYGG